MDRRNSNLLNTLSAFLQNEEQAAGVVQVHSLIVIIDILCTFQQLYSMWYSL